MSLTFKLENQSAGDIRIKADFKSYILDYPCNDQTNCTPYIVTLPPNKYKFELWGAEGGYLGGKGGYTTGTLRIKHETMMYFFIGAKGPETIEVIGRTNPAYNGGGQAAAADTYRSAGSGGGSTDIRVDGETVYHRILVAAAGGGGSSHESGQFPGGSGGGLVGKNSSVFDPQYLSLGATQEGPGQGQEDYGGPSSYVTHSGIFGAGGYGTYILEHMVGEAVGGLEAQEARLQHILVVVVALDIF